MRITLPQPDLLAGLHVVGYAINPEKVVPEWNAVQLHATEAGLTLAVEAQTKLHHTLPISVEESGRVQLPYQAFDQLLQTFPAVPLTLSSKYTTLTLQYQTSVLKVQASIRGRRADALRTVPRGHPGITLDACALAQALDLVTFAASSVKDQSALAGILITSKDEQLTLTAADGFRLSRHIIPCRASTASSFTLLVPVDTLEILRHILQITDVTKLTLISLTNLGEIAIKVGNTTLFTTSITENYPDVQNILDSAIETSPLTVAREPLFQTCRRAALYARPIQLIWKANTLTLSATGDNAMEIHTAINVPTAPQKIDVTFNARFLADLLTALHTSEVVLVLNPHPHPSIFYAANLPHFRHLIMPMTPKT